ncbi:hypothetical protein ABLB90_21110 [Photorhabdus bodei]|uniref:Transposase DDE domain-containing protein n=1 Tax=Photorhabdus kayaii TaxID=230088 RepID=A0ABX0AVD3_9GAMM|nr:MULTISPECIES: hypothetical protein [Photorhabdus]MCC8374996.1 hypothetical protein [Photorhabdus bodei]NDL11154.1 hypothetical protein [Photorhabdus kayaii]NDL24785.1 hypothetical protein [Photorhabdus kayaii]
MFGRGEEKWTVPRLLAQLVLQARHYHTLWISRCFATARERIPGSIDNDVTGVSECSQQRGNLKDDGYIHPRLVFGTAHCACTNLHGFCFTALAMVLWYSKK